MRTIIFLACCLAMQACAGLRPAGKVAYYETSWTHYPDAVYSDEGEHQYVTPTLIGGMRSLSRALDKAGQKDRCTVSGQVLVHAMVGEDGNVVEAQLAQGIGGGCDEVSLEAVERLQFEPVVDQGLARKFLVMIPIRYM